MLTETLELGQDGFGGSDPHKGTGLAVVLLHKSIDFVEQFSYVAEGTPPDRLLGNEAKPAFYLREPRKIAALSPGKACGLVQTRFTTGFVLMGRHLASEA